MVAQAATASKSMVAVQAVDIYAGIYQTGSSDGVSAYRTDVKARTCSCAAGMNSFRNCHRGMCRHLVASRFVARALASITDRVAREQTARMAWKVNVAAVDVKALDLPVGVVFPASVLVFRKRAA